MAAASSEIFSGNVNGEVSDNSSGSDQASTGRLSEERWPSILLSKESFFKSGKTRNATIDPIAVERSNLLGLCKLIIKELIESSLRYGRMLDSKQPALNHFFIVLEHILRHGLKRNKNAILTPKKELWHLLELTGKFMPTADDITRSVRDLPDVKTLGGRSRAWLRLALMEKRLADYFKCLVDQRDIILVDYYESSALMLSEEAVIISGLFVSLNVVDFNICIKDEALDFQHSVLDFRGYLRSSHQTDDLEIGTDFVNIATVLDQKNYIEELNRQLSSTVANLQSKVDSLQSQNTQLKEDMAIANNRVFEHQAETRTLKDLKNSAVETQNKIIEAAKLDMAAERETYQVSRADIDVMYLDLKHKFEDEVKAKEAVARELELQMSMKAEMEMAMKLLEKDIHDKQDTIVSLRRQLEDIKLINLEMYKKLQACESHLKHKTELVTKLEAKTNQMSDVMKEMEHNLADCEFDRTAAEETARKLGLQIADTNLKRSTTETDLKIEREWRTNLQDNIVQDKDRITQLQQEISQLKLSLKEYERLKESHRKLQETCRDHEMTLEDLAIQLGESKLKAEDLKETSKVMTEAVWASDKDVKSCQQCDKEFSISRRKHHCRHCGGIFCNSCSDNTMPLASSQKPIRVCDSCHTLLLSRFLSKT